MINIIVLHGPNLNLLGSISAQSKQRITLDKINKALRLHVRNSDKNLKISQTHKVFQAINFIQRNRNWAHGFLFAPMAWARYEYSILDALKIAEIPTVQLLFLKGLDDMDEKSSTSAEKLTVDQKKRVVNVYHPLVKRHPVTGRKALYGMAGSSFGIIGMPDDEAFDLLNELAVHAIKPAYVTSYDFKVGDAGAWDTFSTLHKATVLEPATGPEDSRLLWRISVTGLPPLIADGQQ